MTWGAYLPLTEDFYIRHLAKFGRTQIKPPQDLSPHESRRASAAKADHPFHLRVPLRCHRPVRVPMHRPEGVTPVLWEHSYGRRLDCLPVQHDVAH